LRSGGRLESHLELLIFVVAYPSMTKGGVDNTIAVQVHVLVVGLFPKAIET
jgi:hypothetical protein